MPIMSTETLIIVERAKEKLCKDLVNLNDTLLDFVRDCHKRSFEPIWFVHYSALECLSTESFF